MINSLENRSDIGWRFDNSYSRLPGFLMSKTLPEKVKNPQLLIFNNVLANELGLNHSNLIKNDAASIFAGNTILSGSKFIAQAYAGHQFGYFTILGDGRAVLMGEHVDFNKKRHDIQLKGSGRTPYSRNGDGRAAIGPILREYIISEAMHFLEIPTTRSLAAVSTGESVVRESFLPGAVLTRVAQSHIRVGTFQYIAAMGKLDDLKIFLEYTINRHFPQILKTNNPPLELLKTVMDKQIKLVTNWMRVGFIHGVMNTDNVAISGETIDYGPCAFMDFYDQNTVFSSIDHRGRYAYKNQPSVTLWNIVRFAETLLPLIDKNKNKALKMVEGVLSDFSSLYYESWFKMMKNKFGLMGKDNEDKNLINSLLVLMEEQKLDFTNTFNLLIDKDIKTNKFYHTDKFVSWYKTWEQRVKKSGEISVDVKNIMKKNNPSIIPRNHKVEEALSAATIDGDLSLIKTLLDFVKKPYEKIINSSEHLSPPKTKDLEYKTFCGT